LNSVNWAVREGIAAPGRLAIMGQSFGGYCALAAATFTPGVFACAVDINGPTDLSGVLKSRKAHFDVLIGSADDPEDAQLVYDSAPANFAHRITCPLLIGQGANDARVNVAGTEQLVNTIQKSGIKVTYVLYPDEGHWFSRPENRTDFNARSEVFLATHLGGRFEPMAGEGIPGSTAVVR
jgi:dipeptidyl aminopeptidase/acylaminoacyl peptidase